MAKGSLRGAAKSARRPVALDLFCGAGGMSLGFEQAGFDVLAAVDNDPVHLATHAYNFPATTAVCADAASASPDNILKEARRAWDVLHSGETWDGILDCVFGGPSCQGFSSIGKRDPTDERNSLIHVFAKFVVTLKPRYFVMENVPGILEPQNRSALQKLLRAFVAAGYVLVADRPLLLDAKSFGVPQTRRRVFLIGARKGYPLPTAPSELASKVTVSDALDDLVDADLYDDLLSSDSTRLHWKTVEAMDRRATAYVKKLRNSGSATTAPVALQYPRKWDPEWLTASGRTLHSHAVRKRFRKTPPGGEEAVGRLPRLDGSGQATTLRAGTGRDHGSFTSARPVHHLHDRVITVREAARLHSFPDWFRFHITKWHGFRQVGNSVPPALARAVASVIVRAQGHELARPSRSLRLGDESLLELSLIAAADHFEFDRKLLPRDSRRETGRENGASHARS